MRLPAPSLVVLVGPPASGKSTWATSQLRPDVIVSSDRLRARAACPPSRSSGVQTAIVNLPDLADVGPIERFADVIRAFAT